MNMQEILQERFKQLGINNSELTRRVVELRKKEGEDTTVRNLQTAVAKALKEPDSRRYSAISELVEAMGGEIVIRWKDYEEVKVL
jgi:Cdc6-like AAA superfamily ATPase